MPSKAKSPARATRPRSPEPPSATLRLLGRSATFPDRPAAAILETFANKHPQRDFFVRFETEDFTSLCPVTGQPDFARLSIEYVPDTRCVETKSLKFYLASFRNEPTFNEDVVNRIADDLIDICAPRRLRVIGRFSARGGIALTTEVRIPDDAEFPPWA